MLRRQHREQESSLYSSSDRHILAIVRLMFVCRIPVKEFHFDSLLPTEKHSGDSDLVWCAIASRGLEPLVLEADVHR
ncbi:hypothetical protein TNCV_1608391 [Trichonephila clavipes]|nr:hypothetical protein TNCV_1608391 [Trichonephila clavipes]